MEKQYLSGHTTPETAYLVTDYPYGFRERTSIRYWLETTKHGTRLVSQTMHPRSGAWNKPKASTYCAFGGVMYLDEKKHVSWEGLSEGSGAPRVRKFIAEHPEAIAGDLRGYILFHVKYSSAWAQGRIVMHVNGVPQETSAADRERSQAEADAWKCALAELESLRAAAE